MALFNKLFSSRKKQQDKTQDYVRECDFRGRKLLFDSATVERVPLAAGDAHETGDSKRFIEITETHGFTFLKPSGDVGMLREMVFGSIAMSYRGTTYKMNRLTDPHRLVCSQVFSSPQTSVRLRNSAPSHIQSSNTSSSEQVVRTDSGASSSSDQSVQSTASDTLLVCRRGLPMDVPQHSSLIASSGYGRSYGSVSSGPQSIPIDLSLGDSHTFSSGSLYKRWLRSTSTSLERSANSISLEENSPKVNVRSSKIGLAVIIQLTAGQEVKLEQFLMDHAALIEAMLFKVRAGVENAYLRHTTFVSSMHETTSATAQWLNDLLTGPYLTSHAWTTLISNCDNIFSIKTKLPGIDFANRMLPRSVGEKFDSSRTESLGADYSFLTRFLKTDVALNKRTCEGQFAEKFVRELCELLENIDAKHTNFFMSTLVTAVLTHHLGWVTGTFPLTLNDKEVLSKLQSSCKPLWGQLNDLYGAIGFPTKMSHTIISGGNKTDLITKILNTLTYFIRCANVKRIGANRADVDAENAAADSICERSACIPQENYKTYEDHLREISASEKTAGDSLKRGAGLRKMHTCVMDLDKLEAKTLGFFGDAERQQRMDIEEAKRQMNRVFRTSEDEKSVLFVLGDDDKLVGLKNSTEMRSTISKSETYPFNEEDFAKYDDAVKIKPSTSCTALDFLEKSTVPRARSEPPIHPAPPSDTTTKYRYSGVKFNLQQYPQIVRNYMRSKNIELSNLQFSEKEFELNKTFLSNTFDFSKYETEDFEEVESLQTPSNASELEFTSDLIIDRPKVQRAKVDVESRAVKMPEFKRSQIENTLLVTDDVGLELENTRKSEEEAPLLKFRTVALPLPKSINTIDNHTSVNYTNSLMRGVGAHYMSNMVLQGMACPPSKWESNLKKDLVASARHSLLDQPIDECVAIVANVDTWEVQLMSSHTYVIDKNSAGVTVGMSQLVANMLESLLHMWRLQTPAEYCIMHIEQRLQEFCMRSKALARLLLETDFCSMELLTSTLQLEVNDVPLLMAVASTHTPQVTQKYGLSFQ